MNTIPSYKNSVSETILRLISHVVRVMNLYLLAAVVCLEAHLSFNLVVPHTVFMVVHRNDITARCHMKRLF